jgi:hypothetical protein
MEGCSVKALTVKNPWAWAIIHGGKDVENRSRPTKHRGQLYIHAGKGWAQEGIQFLRRRNVHTASGFTDAGKVIGTVDLVDCHHADDCGQFHKAGTCSEWAMTDHYHWVLANPRPLACPFPETGKLGLWNLGVKE